MLLPLISQALDTILPRVLKDKDKAFEIKAELTKQLSSQEYDIEKAIIEGRSSIIKAEAQGESFLQRSWRPITMLSFVLILLTYWGAVIFGSAEYVARFESGKVPIDGMYTLLQIGIGGYIGGRSAERMVKQAFPEGWKGKKQ